MVIPNPVTHVVCVEKDTRGKVTGGLTEHALWRSGPSEPCSVTRSVFSRIPLEACDGPRSG